jgi:hypothetical protein
MAMTRVPLLARHQTRQGRLWVYVRDDRPFGGPDPPAAMLAHLNSLPPAPHSLTVLTCSDSNVGMRSWRSA